MDEKRYGFGQKTPVEMMCGGPRQGIVETRRDRSNGVEEGQKEGGEWKMVVPPGPPRDRDEV